MVAVNQASHSVKAILSKAIRKELLKAFASPLLIRCTDQKTPHLTFRSAKVCLLGDMASEASLA
jgi:hypothetical protein